MKINYKKNKYFLYVGRISKEKGVEIFCQVITEIGANGIVVGDGEEKTRLEKKYANINFVGWKDEKEVIKYMKNARALIFPSLIYETMGLTVIEALKNAIPVIVNGNCAASEFVIDNENGYLYYNKEQLIEKMKTISKLNDTIKFEDKFDTQSYVNNLLSIYKKT